MEELTNFKTRFALCFFSDNKIDAFLGSLQLDYDTQKSKRQQVEDVISYAYHTDIIQYIFDVLKDLHKLNLLSDIEITAMVKCLKAYSTISNGIKL